MKLNPLAWVAIAVGAFYLYMKSKTAATVTPTAGNAVASTKSPAGSASGVLTPFGAIGTFLESAFMPSTPPPTSTAGIAQAAALAPITPPPTYGPSDAQLGLSTVGGANTPPDIQDTSLSSGSGASILDISGSDVMSPDFFSDNISLDEDSSGDVIS